MSILKNNNHTSLSDEEKDEYFDGTVKLRNPNIELMDQDILYHLALGSGSHDLEEMFGDVKFVCMGGTPKRMENFAHFIMNEIGYKLPAGTQLQDISAFSYRYSMYKVGPILSISHGMGTPSVSILMHEMIKLMYHAKCQDPIFIRIGTCGGVGVEGGTVIITDDSLDGQLRNSHEFTILGQTIHRPANLDKKLARELKSLASPDDPYDTIIGKTLCTNDFYEGQGRLDGAFCEFSENDKMEYLQKLKDNGVVNIEMESTIFAALTHYAGIKAAIICVALLNRLNGDQDGATFLTINFIAGLVSHLSNVGEVNLSPGSSDFTPLNSFLTGLQKMYTNVLLTFTALDRNIIPGIARKKVNAAKEVMYEWQQRPQILVSRYIRKVLAQKGQLKSLFGMPGTIKSPRRFKLVQQESQAHD